MISYGPTLIAHDEFKHLVNKILIKRNFKNVCEIGGGANPSLTIDFIKRNKINYTILDISQEELDKAPAEFMKIHASIENVDCTINANRFDLVFSKMVAEHIKDDNAFHRNIFSMLKDGGVAIHFIPTLWALPYIINLLIPERIAYKILLWIDPNRKANGKFGKFPAYYRSCQGPTNRQQQKLQSFGYKIIEYKGFFGHAYYYQKWKVICSIHKRFANFLVRHPISYLTSYAYVVLQKESQNKENVSISKATFDNNQPLTSMQS